MEGLFLLLAAAKEVRDWARDSGCVTWKGSTGVSRGRRGLGGGCDVD
jgi:hypothetical protein